MDDMKLGGMHGDLSIDVKGWALGLEDAREGLADFAKEVGNQLKALESTIKKVGAAMTVGLTAPFVGLVGTSVKGAAGFEAAMNKVQAAVGKVDASKIDALSKAARQLGPGVGKNATEAAEGIETLALAGMSADNILSGGLAGTLKLAGANAASLDSAAAAVTDTMSQFKLSVADVPMIVDRITGGLDNSKLGFEDFQLAIAQAGGVAGSAGVSFEDFNTSISATASLFGSGSDAGTSFKVFINSLTGNSKKAKEQIKQLGLSFWDAKDNLKPLADVAGELDRALNGLSGKKTSEALGDIFGTDAMRTAIGLADLGKQGFLDMQTAIAKADAGEKLRIMMQGAEAAVNRLGISFLNLKIAIGETGLLAGFTAVIDKLADFVQWMSELHPTVLSVGLVLGGLVAALGPIALVLGTIGSFLLARVVAGFGLLGQVAAFLISPLSTLVEVVGGLVARLGLIQILGTVGGMLGKIAGPVGLVVAAFTILRDAVIPTLGALWARAQEVLGPPFIALLEGLSAVFGRIAGGPIGGALEWLFGVVAKLTEIVGTFVALLLRIGGEVVIRALAGVVEAMGTVVDMVGGMVDTISRLISGDFAGAWDSFVGIFEKAAHGVSNILGAMVPEASGFFEEMYQAGKTWLADGFGDISAWFGGAIDSAVNAVSTAFPRIVAAAKSVYQGVKQWLVDSFGPLADWIANTASWIGDQYDALRKRLGLGGGDTKGKPASAANAAPPKAVRPSASGGTGGGDSDEKKKGRTAKVIDLEARREMMKLEQQLSVARARNDRDEIKRISDIIDEKRLVNQYEQAGLDKTAARAAAARDMKDILSAEAEEIARQVALGEVALDLQLAEIRGDHAMARALEDQEYRNERIVFWQGKGLALTEAKIHAEGDLAKLEADRADRAAKLATQDALDREADLSRLRADSDARQRAAARAAELNARTAKYYNDKDNPVSEEAARERADRELTEEDRARLQGDFRLTFRDGVRAAMDGDLKDFAKNWWKDQVSKGMEEALNSLSDMLFNLFRQALGQAGAQSGGGTGGLLAGIGSAIGGIFGGGRANALGKSIDIDGLRAAAAIEAPRFATGGSFEVGGKPGIDTNLVQFWGTAGETVDIRRANDNSGRGGSVRIEVVEGALFRPVVSQISGDVSAQTVASAAPSISGGTQKAIGRANSRRLA
ncbi:phage tail tape measure protein [Sphingomonas sp. HH69]